jgi:predicted nucleic acid-binding Zn ribbon protein
MPIFTYKCSNSHETEVITSYEMSLNNRICGKCGKLAVREEWARTGMPILIGEGFYKPSKSGKGGE